MGRCSLGSACSAGYSSGSAEVFCIHPAASDSVCLGDDAHALHGTFF